MIFERITDRNLSLALQVAREIFPYEVKGGKLSFEDDAYRASIRDDQPDFSYSLARFRPSGLTVGLTGWYREDDGTMWLGWFGVLPNARGFGFGTQILRMTADIVSGLGAREGRHYNGQPVREMFIYSGQRVEERNAHRLYEKNGFVKTGDGKVEGEPVFFFRGPVPIGGAS